MHFVNNLHVIKDDLFELPELFKIIQKESETSWEEMYKVFNMGHRMEIYVAAEHAQEIVDISKSFDVDAKVVGRCEKADKNKLTIKSEFGEFHY
jgi:phosphoribosylformylglycinamidine cyclo-ligase